MSWKEKMKEWGGADVTFLSEDGEVIVFIVVADPELVHSKFQGKETDRICVPIVTMDGFSIFVAGKRLARRIGKREKKFKDTAFMVVRRGEVGDTKTRYELSDCPDKDLTQLLFDSVKEVVSPAIIKEAMSGVGEIIEG